MRVRAHATVFFLKSALDEEKEGTGCLVLPAALARSERQRARHAGPLLKIEGTAKASAGQLRGGRAAAAAGEMN